jgi:hypothetical protein
MKSISEMLVYLRQYTEKPMTIWEIEFIDLMGKRIENKDMLTQDMKNHIIELFEKYNS